MAFLGIGKKAQPVLKEEIKAFQGKGDFNRGLNTIKSQRGQGWETLAEIPGFNAVQVQGFNLFYNTYINRVYEYELQRIKEYRVMASIPIKINDSIILMNSKVIMNVWLNWFTMA